MVLWITVLFAALLAWTALWALKVRAWTKGELRAGVRPADLMLSLVIPARNEAARLPALLASLRGEGPAGMEILVVDDESEDATAECAIAASALDARVRLLPSAPKPDGWSGKTWALTRGADAASADILIFCDADMVLKRGVIDAACARLADDELDALALVPRMRPLSFMVSLLVTCFSLARALLFRPAAPGRRGLVQGAFLMVRRSVFDKAGGFRVVRDSLLEDVQFGHRLYQAGFRVSMVPAQAWVETVMYGTLAEAMQGIRRISFAVLGFSFAWIAAALGIYLSLFLFPVLSCVMGFRLVGLTSPTSLAAAGALLSCGVLVAFYGAALDLAKREKFSMFSVMLLPFSLILFLAAVAQSVVGYRWRGIPWKGRCYRPNTPAAGHSAERASSSDLQPIAAARSADVSRRSSWLYS